MKKKTFKKHKLCGVTYFSKYRLCLSFFSFGCSSWKSWTSVHWSSNFFRNSALLQLFFLAAFRMPSSRLRGASSVLEPRSIGEIRGFLNCQFLKLAWTVNGTLKFYQSWRSPWSFCFFLLITRMWSDASYFKFIRLLPFTMYWRFCMDFILKKWYKFFSQMGRYAHS